jgi:integrase
MNYAVRKRVTDRNPFADLAVRGRGRADRQPPTVKQMEALLDACDVLDDYADQMRAFLTVGAYTAMRPSEMYELQWFDIDFAANRVHVSRRLYRGVVDVPKNGEPKTIALPPPARDVYCASRPCWRARVRQQDRQTADGANDVPVLGAR